MGQSRLNSRTEVFVASVMERNRVVTHGNAFKTRRTIKDVVALQIYLLVYEPYETLLDNLVRSGHMAIGQRPVRLCDTRAVLFCVLLPSILLPMLRST